MTPDDIERRSLRTLEWDRLKAFLAFEAETRDGKTECALLAPSDARLLVEQLLDETNEAVSMIQARSALSLGGLPSMSETLTRLSAGAALSVSELNDLRRTLVITRQIKGSLSLLTADNFPRLSQYAPSLHVLENLQRAIEDAIDDAGNIKDEASSLLRSLRKEVHRLDGNIKDELMRIIHSSTLSKALQEPIFTQRGGRYVLPVNANMRSTINGIVHDSSASGLTVYVEPMAVVELANKMRMKEADIEHEIARILAELSQQARAEAEPITSSYTTLIELDVIMAKARLSLKYNGSRPELSHDYSFSYKEARHPLLVLQANAAKVVPNSVELGGLERTLVITGPNTGGKTVLLKTVGILSLMVKAGLLLPARPGSRAALFGQIWADIGDEQSLEQSLSTFSSHMTNIVEVVNNAKEGMLVLLDEIGAGTDPREGAALARSVLEHLNQSKAVTISTTHYGELKMLAYTEAGFINGSLDFDEATLSPTYRLRLGVPGSSKATTISQRLGLDLNVVERARQLIDQSDRDLQETIEQLEKKLTETEKREQEAQETLARAQQMKENLEKQLDQLSSESEKQRLLYSSELEQEFKLSREYIKHLIADLQKQPSLPKAQKIQKDLEKVRKELGWMDRAQMSAPSPDIKVGQNVRVVSLNQVGTVEAVPEDFEKQPDALVVVRAGNLKIKVPRSDIAIQTQETPSSGPGKKGRRNASLEYSTQQKKKINQNTVFVRSMSNTLDLRGQRVDQALANLERFLDESVLSGTSPLMVIHGHGTGAVRSGVRQYLAESDYASQWRPGETYEGGDGVTVIDI